ncbi:MAG: hypothetical protein JWM80_1676 [Cyanobacteria bacterium RYN_339]|nr:hypothetical protein [Cyanobacteria bacterium RYN_339]
MKRLALLLAACVLAGCPTREFYLNRSEVPWEERGILKVELPAFEAPAEAWAAADAARRAIAEALGRGTVTLVETGEGQAVLHGAITNFTQRSTPSGPRRVQKQTTTLTGEVYAWDMDVTHVVQLTLVLRLVTKSGTPVWSREQSGMSTETNTVTLNWPGSDPVPPPASMPLPPDPLLYDRLRQSAVRQALDPMIEALAVHYAYRNL